MVFGRKSFVLLQCLVDDDRQYLLFVTGDSNRARETEAELQLEAEEYGEPRAPDLHPQTCPICRFRATPIATWTFVPRHIITQLTPAGTNIAALWQRHTRHRPLTEAPVHPLMRAPNGAASSSLWSSTIARE